MAGPREFVLGEPTTSRLIARDVFAVAQIIAAASHVLPNHIFWEAINGGVLFKSLISMVGAQGLEPWTR